MASKRRIKVGQVTGTSWYVRPSGSTYGSANGTSYDNAWSGFAAIQWASIQPGDTLYVAGMHTRPNVTTARTFEVKKSGVAGSPITIASCETQYGASANDAGTIWGAVFWDAGGWSVHSGDTYTRSMSSLLRSNYEFAFAVEADGNVLIAAETLDECLATPGSFYRDPFVNYAPAYYHPTAAGLKDLYYHGQAAVWMNGYEYVTLRGLTLRYGGLSRGVVLIADGDSPIDTVRGVTIDRCDIGYSPGHGVFLGGKHGWVWDGITLTNNTIFDCTAGFYPATDWGTNTLIARNFTVTGNRFYSTANMHKRGPLDQLGKPYPSSPGDECAIATQGGIDNFVITHNHIDGWIGDGIFLFLGNGYGGIANTMHDNVIAYNRVHMDGSDPNRSNLGIQIGGDNLSNFTDLAKRMLIFNNVITGCHYSSWIPNWAAGIRCKFTTPTDPADAPKIHNNTIHDCYIGINIATISTSSGSALDSYKNNIVSQPESGTATGYFIYNATVGKSADIDIDYNCYYGTGKWKWNGSSTEQTTLAEYQLASGKDANSTSGDPLFTDAANEDFTLQSGSACVNTGTATDLTDDLAGNPRPVGNYDMGAYERQ